MLDALDAIERRADVEGEHGRAVGLGRRGVVVDHVANFFPLTVYVSRNIPIVSIERWFGAITWISVVPLEQ